MYGSLITNFKNLDSETKRALNQATCGTCKAIRRNLGPQYIGLPFGDSIGINIIGRALGAPEKKSNDYSSAVHGLGLYVKSLDTWIDNDSILRNVSSKRCEKLPEKVDELFSSLNVPLKTRDIVEQVTEGMKKEEEFKKGAPYTLESILEKTTYPVRASFEGLSSISGKSKNDLRELGYSTGVILSIHDAKKDLKKDKEKFNIIKDFKKSEVSRVYDYAVETIDNIFSSDLLDKEPYDILARGIFDNLKNESEPPRSAKYKIQKVLTTKGAMMTFMAAPLVFNLINVAIAQGAVPQEANNGCCLNSSNGCENEKVIC
ncbi:MAG: DUF5685 family protein, partial [Candidatus Heimdallarchaeaceae archaeon]